MQAGIVGLPNVGKSTIFNALTAAGAEAANYPFCTIEPNVGIVPVYDPRLHRIQKHIPTDRVVPAVVEIVDIAGLVRGASKGEGLGNQFLAHIRNVDAILHVVRCFEDHDVVHVDGGVDPIRDIETIDTELALADLESLERRVDRLRKTAQAGDKQAAERVPVIDKALALLAAGRPVRAGTWEPNEARILREWGIITAKPVLYLCNVDEGAAAAGNELSARVQSHAEREGSAAVVLSGRAEAEISELDEADRGAFLVELGLAEPGLHKLARAAYALLGLETYFTAGEKEIRAWTVRRGAKAPEAAGVIHSDFERGFIRAEVYTLPDLEAHGTEAALRARGKLRVEGKEYVVQDGDILHFRFSA